MIAEAPLRPGWLRGLALLTLGVSMSVLAWWPAISLWPATQTGDGQTFLRIFDMAHVSYQRFKELPLWNAYECGGVPLWDNPEMPAASPLVFLTTPLGVAATMIVWYVAHSAVGFVGMWLFLREDLQRSRAAAFVGSCLFAFGVAHTSQYAGGHASLTSFLFLPLCLMLWRRAESSGDASVGLGLVVAWMMFDGGVYPLVHVGSILAVETVTRLVGSPRRLAGVVRASAVVLAVGLCVGAARFLPVFDQVRHHSRDLGVETDFVAPHVLKSMFLDRHHDWRTPGQTYVWPEYQAYHGRLLLVLAAIGALALGRGGIWIAVVGAFAFAMMLGHFKPWAPWAYLKAHVFPFKAMRVPSRFRISVTFFLAAWVASAIDQLPALLRRVPRLRQRASWVRAGLLAAALLGAGDVLGLTGEIIESKFIQSAQAPVVPVRSIYIEGPGIANWIDQPRQNRGRMGCLDSWVFTDGAPIWPGDVPQARAVDPQQALVTNVHRTMNRLFFDVEVRTPSRVLLNLPWERGFRTNVGTLVDDQKLLALDLPKGKHRVRVRYWPFGLTVGLWASGLGLLASILYLSRRPIRAYLTTLRREPPSPPGTPPG